MGALLTAARQLGWVLGRDTKHNVFLEKWYHFTCFYNGRGDVVANIRGYIERLVRNEGNDLPGNLAD